MKALYASPYIWITLALLCSGCAITKPLKPGQALQRATSGASSTLVQPENPAAESKQGFERTEERATTIPAGTVIREVTTAPQRDTNLAPIQIVRTYTLKEPVVETTRTGEKTTAEIGAAQKDTAREIGAKLSAMRPVRVLGAILLLAALAMFHPAVAAITMSRTLQMVTGGVGLALIFLPSIIVGHEGVIIAAGIAIPCVWYFAHRHGQLRAMAESAPAPSSPDPLTPVQAAPAPPIPRQDPQKPAP